MFNRSRITGNPAGMRALARCFDHFRIADNPLSNLMSWQASTALMLQERLGLEKYVTAQMYYSLVGRGLEYEFQSFAEYHNIGILVWSPLAGGFLSGKYDRNSPASAGTRFADAGQFVPLDKEIGYRVVDVLKEVARRHNVSPSSVALAWLLNKPAISSVIIAGRKAEHLEDNIQAVDLRLSEDDLRQLDAVSDPGIPYPKRMVLQLDTAEDPRSRILHPDRYAVAEIAGRGGQSAARCQIPMHLGIQDGAVLDVHRHVLKEHRIESRVLERQM